MVIGQLKAGKGGRLDPSICCGSHFSFVILLLSSRCSLSPSTETTLAGVWQ